MSQLSLWWVDASIPRVMDPVLFQFLTMGVRRCDACRGLPCAPTSCPLTLASGRSILRLHSTRKATQDKLFVVKIPKMQHPCDPLDWFVLISPEMPRHEICLSTAPLVARARFFPLNLILAYAATVDLYLGSGK